MRRYLSKNLKETRLLYEYVGRMESRGNYLCQGPEAGAIWRRKRSEALEER